MVAQNWELSQRETVAKYGHYPTKKSPQTLNFFGPQCIKLFVCLYVSIPYFPIIKRYFFPSWSPLTLRQSTREACGPIAKSMPMWIHWSKQATPTINKSNVVGIAENTCNQYSLSHRTSKIKFKFTSHILGTTLEIKFIHIRLVPHSYYSTPSRNSLDRTYIN